MNLTNIEKLQILEDSRKLIETKKIITPAIKAKLIEMGFKEIRVGSKDIHAINSKELKIGFLGYDIAIGLSARPISYGSGRMYYALVIKFY